MKLVGNFQIAEINPIVGCKACKIRLALYLPPKAGAYLRAIFLELHLFLVYSTQGLVCPHLLMRVDEN